MGNELFMSASKGHRFDHLKKVNIKTTIMEIEDTAFDRENDRVNDRVNESSDDSDDETVAPKIKSDREAIVAKYAHKIKTDDIKGPKISKDRANRATVEQVLDPRTMGFLAKLINKGIITRINGCISTGKEANVYHGDCETEGNETQYAVKIYKTSILVFKDRERYIDGEFRFRNSKNQSNPRKMVKVWAEKEFRNLKRLYLNGIPCPEPIDIRSHVLVMEYLTKGNGEPSPKLKDHPFQDLDEIVYFYHQMLFYIRRMYWDCKLVHADLSEYNSIVHQGKLYIFDVSQSVEPDHTMSLDFLRMDIKNVNDFFNRKKINVYPERLIFKYVIENNEKLGIIDNSDEELGKYLDTLPLKSEDEDEVEDEVFRSVHLIRSLNNLDERDFGDFSMGKINTLTELVGDGPLHTKNESSTNDVEVEEDDSNSDTSDTDNDDSELSSDDDDSDDNADDDSHLHVHPKIKPPKGKKFEDKEEKKLRKETTKNAKQEKRKTKMKKHVKKKIVNKRKK